MDWTTPGYAGETRRESKPEAYSTERAENGTEFEQGRKLSQDHVLPYFCAKLQGFY